MTHSILRLPVLVSTALIVCGLGGCGTVNSKLANGMGDYMPQWAGGLPPDAPPRPGTLQYDEMMKERERERLEPAKPAAAAANPSAAPGAATNSSAAPNR